MLRHIIMIALPTLAGLLAVAALARVTVCGVEMRRDRI